MRKELFDFNKMYNFYVNKKLGEGRTMLYENINVFLRHSGFNIIEGYDDIVGDVVLEIDKWLQDSIHKGYKNGQVYSYIKFRLNGFLKNRYTRRDSMTYFKSYGQEYVEGMSSIEGCDEYELSIIRDFVMEMDDPYRTIMLLKHFNDEQFTINKISKYISKSIVDTTKMYKECLLIIKGFLTNTPLEDEDIDPS